MEEWTEIENGFVKMLALGYDPCTEGAWLERRTLVLQAFSTVPDQMLKRLILGIERLA